MHGYRNRITSSGAFTSVRIDRNGCWLTGAARCSTRKPSLRLRSRADPAVSDRSHLYRGFHFPAEVISHAVWLYARRALSYRDVEELLSERGIQVSYESVRHSGCGPLRGGTTAWSSRTTHSPAGAADAGFPIHALGPAVSLPLQPHLQFFRPRRHWLPAAEYRATMHIRFRTWNAITSVVCAYAMRAASPGPTRLRSDPGSARVTKPPGGSVSSLHGAQRPP